MVISVDLVDLVELADSVDSVAFVLTATGAEVPLMPALLAPHSVAHLSRAQRLGKYSSLVDGLRAFMHMWERKTAQNAHNS